MREHFLRRLRGGRLLAMCALMAASLGAGAQAPSPNFYPPGAQPQAHRPSPETPPLRIDGRLDEAPWQSAPVHDAFVQYLPRDRQPVPEGYRTTMQIVVEEHALVVGIRAWDPHPEEIRAPLIRRDQVRRDQDFVSVVIDPVGTRRSAQFVRVNAAGVIADGMFIAATDTEDFAPDFEVEAAVQRLPDGYSVEVRLPLMTLRYPYEGGAPWRIMVTRSIPRESSMLLLSAPLTKDALSFIAELQPIAGLEDIAERVRSHALLSVRPELTLRSSRRSDGVTSERESRGALGAEIKWRPRADWVFDATLNPDFSQVELDVPQLAGNTRFALSVPEKRPFFLESTDVLDLPLAAFYSRSITDPGWGLRATWRGVQADATALTLRDDGGGLLLRPGPFATDVLPQDRRSQATLLRGRWHAEQFSVGALLSQRDETAGANNRVAGADVVWRPDEEQQFRARVMASRSRDDAGAPGESGHHLNAAWWLRVPGWNFTAEATEISPKFRNDNGFVEQAGARILQTELIRRWGEVQVPGPVGFKAHEFETYLWLQHKSTMADAAVPGGQTIGRYAHPGIWLAASRNTEASVQLQLDAERARTDTALHSLRALNFSYSVNPTPWLTKLHVESTLGQRLDVEADRVGRGVRALFELNLRAPLGPRWWIESEQRVEQNFVDAPDGRRALSDTALQWLGVLHFDARDSMRAVWQGTRFVRYGTGELPAPADLRGQSTSIVFQRRLGLGRSLSAGLSRQTQRPALGAPRLSESELFVKASFEFGS